ncbi:MAG: hypothetical protein HY077_11015 [Elusimicrobia bacterium]|nr:hypothetical protein [Elusimicrobiota bacterium]
MDDVSHEDLAFLYYSGELEGAQRAEFEAHRGSCAACGSSLEDLSRLSRLARQASLEPASALVAAALRRTRPASAAWSRWDWARGLGLGFGLAFAAGLLLFRLSRPSPRDYPWRNGLETEMREVGQRLDRMESSVSRDSWSVEYKDDCDDLSRRQRALESQLARPEGA